MASTPPISCETIFDLTSAGVEPSSLRFSATSLESPAHVIVREPGEEDRVNVATVFITEGTVERRKMKADGAHRHPTRNVIAIRSGAAVQVYDLDAKGRIFAQTFESNIKYLKWTNEETLAILDEEDVHQWYRASVVGTDA